MRDTPPYRALPFRDSIAEGGIAPICLVFIGYRASIAEIPLLRGGYRTSILHALQGGNAQKRGTGYRTQLAMLRHQKPDNAQYGGIAEIVSRYRAIRATKSVPRKCPGDDLGANPRTSVTSRPDLCAILHRLGRMSMGQTGHFRGTDGTRSRDGRG